MIGNATLDRLASEVLLAGAMELRAVPARVTNAEVDGLPLANRPFLYASGNWGPGYIMVKGLVGQPHLMRMLCKYLAFELAEKWPTGIDFVAGNVTGGMIPGWIVAYELSELLGKTVPFVYIRELRKTGGHKELITGVQKNPEILSGAQGVDMEELVNFAQTIVNGAGVLRAAGFQANKGTCLLYYGNPEADKELANAGIEMTYLLALPRLIDVAEKIGVVCAPGLDRHECLADYRRFLQNPKQWQAERGLVKVEKGGTQ